MVLFTLLYIGLATIVVTLIASLVRETGAHPEATPLAKVPAPTATP
jgi:hypothetical protein